MDLPHTEIGFHFIQDLRPIPKSGRNLIQHRILRGPVISRKMERSRESLFLEHVDGNGISPLKALHGSLVHHVRVQGNLQLHLTGQLTAFRQHVVHGHDSLINIRRKPDPVEPGPAHRLQPHALPDPRAGCIPDKFRFLLPVLFSSGDGLVGEWVPDFHPHPLLLPAQIGGDIPLKRGLPSCVLSRELSIHIHPAAIVHGPEMQEDDFSSPLL